MNYKDIGSLNNRLITSEQLSEIKSSNDVVCVEEYCTKEGYYNNFIFYKIATNY